MKPVLLILSTKESEYPKIQDDRFYIHYFVADPSMMSKYKYEGNIVYFKIPDNFESISLLVYEAIKWLSKKYTRMMGIFKTDDDIQINIDKLLLSINENIKYKYFGEVYQNQDHYSEYHFGKCESESMNTTQIFIPRCQYCSGIGYFISRDVINNIISNKDFFTDIPYDDICVGLSLNKNNIFPHPVDINEICSELLLPVSEKVSQKLNPIPDTPRPKPVSQPQPVTLSTPTPRPTAMDVCVKCGHPKNRVRYNFCQKCGKLY